MIEGMIFVVRFESEGNRQLNLDGLEFKSSTIRFVCPHRLSLVCVIVFLVEREGVKKDRGQIKYLRTKEREEDENES